MKVQIEQRIIDNFQYLDTFQLSEILDFAEFLRYRKNNRSPDFSVFDSLCGKYKNYLSHSDDFARRKQEEIKIEEEKWQKNG